MHTRKQAADARCRAPRRNAELTRPGWGAARERRSSRSALEQQETVVYSHYDEEGVLLYVGISRKPGARNAAHERDSAWYAQVANTTYRRYKTRSEAEAEERRVISDCRPRFNRNAGIKKTHWTHTSATTAPVTHTAPATSTAPDCAPVVVSVQERVVTTLKAADRPLSFEAVIKLTTGKTQSIRDAISELVASGQAVAEKGTCGNRLVLADRTYLLAEVPEVSRKHEEGEMRERVIAAISQAGRPIPLSGVIRRTCGKTRHIRSQVQALIDEGVLVETPGPRQARLVRIAR